MIPRTFPSSVASNGSAQMIVYFLPSVSGLTRWVDYIPVKFTTVATAATENTYNQNGYIPVVSISSIAGATPFKEYVPVYLDSSATDAEVWKVNITGFIPVGTAGIGGAALYMDFAATTTIDPRVTFSRTTNATLTNSAGLVANAPMNLLTFSEQFDNAAWTKTRTTITANAIEAPDGSVTADKLIASTDNNTHFLSRSLLVTGLHNLSCYFKAAEYSQVYFGDGSGFAKSVTVNLLTGAVVSSGGSASNVSVTAAGNGWYRVSFAVTDATGVYVFVDNGSGLSFAGNGTSGIYVWGAQVELGSTATPYNPTTVKNLLGYTEHFDNAAWTKSNATITSGFTDIYGQPFAQSITSGAANATVLSSYTAVASTPYTFSVYLQRVSGTGNVDISVDGTNWVTQTLTTTLKRFTVTGSPTAGAKTPGIRVVSSGDVIIAFGAQLSDSASVDPYVYQPVAAPTSTAYYGPRFDYDPVTLAPKGLLIEEQRTNLLLNSVMAGGGSAPTSFSQPTGTGSSAPVVSTVSTIGTAYSQTAIAQRPFIETGFTATGGTTYAVSFIVESVSGGLLNSQILNGASTPVTAYFLNGVSVAASDFATTGKLTAIITPSTSGSTLTRFGVGVTGNVTGTLRFSCPQIEAGAFATSYIPTGASQVTRAADSASMIGNNFARWYTQGVGTIFSQFDTPASGNRPVVSIDDNTANNMIRLRTETTDPYFRVVTGGAAQADLDVGTVAANTIYKMAGGFGSNSFLSCINAGTVGSDTSGTIPTVDRLRIGSDQAGAYLNGHIARTAYYGRVLTATEDQGITQ